MGGSNTIEEASGVPATGTAAPSAECKAFDKLLATKEFRGYLTALDAAGTAGKNDVAKYALKVVEEKHVVCTQQFYPLKKEVESAPKDAPRGLNDNEKALLVLAGAYGGGCVNVAATALAGKLGHVDVLAEIARRLDVPVVNENAEKAEVARQSALRAARLDVAKTVIRFANGDTGVLAALKRNATLEKDLRAGKLPRLIIEDAPTNVKKQLAKAVEAKDEHDCVKKNGTGAATRDNKRRV